MRELFSAFALLFAISVNAQDLNSKLAPPIPKTIVEKKNQSLTEANNALIFCDGKEISKKELANIATKRIASINIIKKEEVLKIYGEKAKDGIIEIKLN